MAKKTPTKKSPKPSAAAMAAAKEMLAPLHDLLRTSVKQNELNAGMLSKLNDRVEKLATQLDRLQKISPADPKLLTEPAPLPVAPAVPLTEATEPPHA